MCFARATSLNPSKFCSQIWNTVRFVSFKRKFLEVPNFSSVFFTSSHCYIHEKNRALFCSQNGDGLRVSCRGTQARSPPPSVISWAANMSIYPRMLRSQVREMFCPPKKTRAKYLTGPLVFLCGTFFCWNCFVGLAPKNFWPLRKRKRRRRKKKWGPKSLSAGLTSLLPGGETGVESKRTTSCFCKAVSHWVPRLPAVKNHWWRTAMDQCQCGDSKLFMGEWSPFPVNIHHLDFVTFFGDRGCQPEPSFATILGRGDNPNYFTVYCRSWCKEPNEKPGPSTCADWNVFLCW